MLQQIRGRPNFTSVLTFQHEDGSTERVRLTNFTARIIEDVVIDDGGETRRAFRIAAILHGQTTVFDVPAERFPGMTWPAEHLGARAIVYPSQGAREHLRVGLQTLSGEIPERIVYAHTGWQHFEDSWVYLHAGGGIGADSTVRDVSVSLPEFLSGYVLPDPPRGDDARGAFRASLGIVNVGPAAVTYPGFAAVYRAPLGDTDFSLHLAGPSGVGKSELAALLQQHWGAAMDARHLPSGWDSTSNALELIAYAVKDAVLVVDDFAPGGTPHDVARRHRDADRLLRAQGNQAGRARLSAEAIIHAARPPRGLIVSTGEDVPRGHSVRARILVAEVEPDAVDWNRLSACQHDAARGLYAAALSGYVCWLAGRYLTLTRLRRHWLARLRRHVVFSDHKRAPEIIANLAIGLHLALRYGRDIGALSPTEARSHARRGWDVLKTVGARQTQHQDVAEPTHRYLDLLRAALASGSAHVTNPQGGTPPTPHVWGWRSPSDGQGLSAGQEWRPQCSRVGWIDGDDLYLDLDASYAVVQDYGRRIGDPPALTPRTLCKRLAERNLLATVDPARESLTIRRTLEGVRRNVLHLRTRTVAPRPEYDQPDHNRDRILRSTHRMIDTPSAGLVPADQFAGSSSARSARKSVQDEQAVGLLAHDAGPSARTTKMPGPFEGSVTCANDAHPERDALPDQPDQAGVTQLNLDLGELSP